MDSQKLSPRVEESINRGHGLRCEEQDLKEMYEISFFTQRVAGVWNSLPWEVTEADMKVSFQRHLDKYISRMGIEEYGPRKIGDFR